MAYKPKSIRTSSCSWILLLVISIIAISDSTLAQDPTVDVLSSAEWERVDESVDRGLTWLASTQQRSGAFPTLPQGQPGVTSLCVLAFAAHGHVPGEGPYGAQLLKAVEFIMSCQKQNGLIALVAPRGRTISRNVNYETGTTATYNHAISSLALSEVYAMGEVSKLERIQSVL